MFYVVACRSTEPERQALGQSIDWAFPLDHLPPFGELLRDIDEAERQSLCRGDLRQTSLK